MRGSGKVQKKKAGASRKRGKKKEGSNAEEGREAKEK